MAYKVPDSFVPDIAQEAIVEGIAGAIVLYGSPAAIVRNDLVVNGAMRDGDSDNQRHEDRVDNVEWRDHFPNIGRMTAEPLAMSASAS